MYSKDHLLILTESIQVGFAVSDNLLRLTLFDTSIGFEQCIAADHLS